MFFFFFQPDSYIAVIGDIKNSRNLENRSAQQEKLKKVLMEINKKYQSDITSKFLITLGDEFQGLLNSGRNVLKIICEIKMMMHPVEIRFGIGAGKITTSIYSDMALGADGPGYYNARSAIDLLKENEKKKKTAQADICLKADTDYPEVEALLNTVLELLYSIESKWTNRQREIIFDMMQHEDGQQKTADRFGITQATVQKVLASGSYYSYKMACENIESILGELKK